MKKTLVIAMCVAVVGTFAACGSSSSESSNESEEPIVEEADTETEETVTEETDIETEEAEDAEPEYETAAYKNMTYSYPADSEYAENGDTVSITVGNSEVLIMIMSIDLSVSDDEYDEDDIDVLLEATIDSMNATYDDIQDESTEDVTVAGCPAREEIAMVSMSDTWMGFNGMAIYDGEGRYVYAIQYLDKTNLEGESSGFQALIDSITIGEDNAVPEENGDTENSSAESGFEAAHFDGYDITYQDYELYETSNGEPRVYAIVEVENTSDTNLKLGNGNFTFTDDEGNLVAMASIRANTDPNIIMPGEKGYFYLDGNSLDGDVNINENYIFIPELSLEETDKEQDILEVSDTNISEGKYDKADIMGRITNTTDNDYGLLWVACVLFDQNDNPIAVYGTNVRDLTAGSTQSFDADASNLNHLDFSYNDVARYEVIARK